MGKMLIARSSMANGVREEPRAAAGRWSRAPINNAYNMAYVAPCVSMISAREGDCGWRDATTSIVPIAMIASAVTTGAADEKVPTIIRLRPIVIQAGPDRGEKSGGEEPAGIGNLPRRAACFELQSLF